MQGRTVRRPTGHGDETMNCASGAGKSRRHLRTLFRRSVSYYGMVDRLSVRCLTILLVCFVGGCGMVRLPSGRDDITLKRKLQVIRAASIDMHIWIRKWSVHSRRTIPVGMPRMPKTHRCEPDGVRGQDAPGGEKSHRPTAVSLPGPTPAGRPVVIVYDGHRLVEYRTARDSTGSYGVHVCSLRFQHVPGA